MVMMIRRIRKREKVVYANIENAPTRTNSGRIEGRKFY